MKKQLLILATLAFAACSQKSVAPTIPTAGEKPVAPIAEKIPTKLEKHGQTRIDNYFWMKDRENPKVISYLNAENDYLEKVLAPAKDLREELFNEMKSRVKEDDESARVSKHGYLYWSRVRAGLQYPIYLRKKPGAQDKEETLLDVNELAKDKPYTACGAISESDDQQRLIYACDFVGRRFYEIRGKDLKTGADLGFSVPNTAGQLAWSANDNQFFYVKQDPNTLRSYQVYRYDIATKKETLVYEEKDATFNVSLSDGPGEKFLFINSGSTLSTEVRYIERNKPEMPFKVFLPREAKHEYQVFDGRDRFYVLTNWDAKDFRIMVVARDRTAKKSDWKNFVGHKPGVLIEDVEVFQDWVIYKTREKGLDHLYAENRQSHKRQEITFRDQNYTVEITGNAEYVTDAVRYEYESQRQPSSIFEYDLLRQTSALIKAKEVPNYNPENYKTERIWITARDGYKIPVSLVMRRDFEPNGQSPMLVYGYGSYGFSMSPWFSPRVFSLVDRGWVYALTHIRGGSELGRAHYENGRTLKKMNTFTDFIDTTEALVKMKYADPKKVSALGGSAGGLLMGAVYNMRPDLYHSVVAQVPFVDVVTTMLDESIPLTTGEYDEWGNPNELKYYSYIMKYSPYDNVERKAYPHLLAMTGLHDSQVQYWEPAKWVAKLREMKTSDSYILLKTDMTSGHGGASGRYEALKDWALVYAFLLTM